MNYTEQAKRAYEILTRFTNGDFLVVRRRFKYGKPEVTRYILSNFIDGIRYYRNDSDSGHEVNYYNFFTTIIECAQGKYEYSFKDRQGTIERDEYLLSDKWRKIRCITR